MNAMAELSDKRRPAPAPLDLVEAFINTADRETGSDVLATPQSLRAWFLDHRPSNHTRVEPTGA